MTHASRENSLDVSQKKFLEKFNSLYSLEGAEDYRDMIDHLRFLDSRKVLRDCVVSLIDFKKAKAYFVSNSVERIFGYTPQEYIKKNLFFQRGHKEKQPRYLQEIAGFMDHFRHLSERNEPRTVQFIAAGSFFKTKDGSYRRILTKYNLENIPEGVLPEVDIILHYDITELLKGDDFWVYQEKETSKDHISRLYTTDKIEKHLISPREKQVLKLIVEGKKSKEIADILNISQETVGQHRKNMIKRTQAKDSSALIQLCKICELL